MFVTLMISKQPVACLNYDVGRFPIIVARMSQDRLRAKNQKKPPTSPALHILTLLTICEHAMSDLMRRADDFKDPFCFGFWG